MEKWKPGNRGGRMFYDPKQELGYWIARSGSDSMVAVPVNLLVACLRRRECHVTRTFASDEDGPLLPPKAVYCVLNDDHLEFGVAYHTNGYYNWLD